MGGWVDVVVVWVSRWVGGGEEEKGNNEYDGLPYILLLYSVLRSLFSKLRCCHTQVCLHNMRRWLECEVRHD
jgi:hypothetical protein